MCLYVVVNAIPEIINPILILVYTQSGSRFLWVYLKTDIAVDARRRQPHTDAMN
jgi:hypothetical protein